ncbi:MAG TPA: nucleotide disphospho-sugar-binding domain-containing protein [Vicinamibacterales bacterium]|nr:nucleotide disphospho-sugar-binding domain-containing protein [Vicinamibacterales bacterium]
MASTSAYRVVMFPDGNFLAHASRLLEIARVLRRDFGCDVRFAGDGPFMSLPREAGFHVDRGYTVPREETLALASRATVVDPLWWSRVVQRSIRSDLDAIARHQPDAVVGDMHWSLHAAARDAGVPYVSVVNAAWTRYLDHQLAALDEHVLTRALGTRAATRIMPFARTALLWYWAWPYKVHGWRRATRAPATLADVMEGDLTIFPDVPGLAPVSGCPPTARYVGPILWEPPAPAPEWVSRLDPDRTIYVSAGSTGTRELFDLAMTALAGSGYDVVMSTGELNVPTAPAAANIRVTKYVRGLAVMRRSAVSINHGGNGTVYQALACGVPVVGIPSHVDQQLQLQLCERAGVGRKLAARTTTPAQLRDAVDALVSSPSVRQRARDLAAEIARYDGPRTAAASIVDLCARRDTRQRRSRVPPEHQAALA